MADEVRVHEGDALIRGDRGDQLGGLAGIGGGLYVEAERPEIVLEGRPGYRCTGENGGRQTNSLLGAGGDGHAGLRPGCGSAARRLRLSDERKSEFTARLCAVRAEPGSCAAVRDHHRRSMPQPTNRGGPAHKLTA